MDNIVSDLFEMSVEFPILSQNLLANNNDIVILRPDKGSWTVILNRDDYIKKLFDIISDTSKFKKLPADPTLVREGQLQRFLSKLKNK